MRLYCSCTAGSLVKALEELGIGRPSTYASIIDKLQARSRLVDVAVAIGMRKRMYACYFSVRQSVAHALPPRCGQANQITKPRHV